MLTLESMDRIAAEQILGWDYSLTTTEYLSRSTGKYVGYVGRGSPHFEEPVWEPTTNLECAWELLERFRSYHITSTPTGILVVVITDRGQSFQAEGDLVTEVITRASLLAYGVSFE